MHILSTEPWRSKRFWRVVGLAVGLVAGVRAQAEQLLDPSAMRADMDTLFSVLQAVHPDLYATTPKARVDSARQALTTYLLAPTTRAGFYFALAPLVAGLGDGHTSLSFPREDYVAFRKSGGLAWPLQLSIDETNGATVLRSYSPDTTIGSGDRLRRVNGLDADSLIRFFESRQSGERRSFRLSQVAAMFRPLLWCAGIAPPYRLEFSRQVDGASRAATLAGVTQACVQAGDSLAARSGTSRSPYSYAELDGGVGYLEFRSMVDLPAFKRFLKPVFLRIRDKPIRGLVIDLQKNGGGSSLLGDELLSYLTDRPYRMAQSKEWRMSARYKATLLDRVPVWLRWFPFTWISATARSYLDAPDGAIVVDSATVDMPRRNPLRYRGPVCFLIGPGTFSSAMMLANAVADFHLATLIGEETGGNPNAFGEVYSFRLPHSGLPVSVSSARFVRANGRKDQRGGVLPDIRIAPEPSRRETGKDAALERARQWIDSGGTRPGR